MIGTRIFSKNNDFIKNSNIKILERTWKQARNETFKVHEMKQLY
jgi:hypothetical protein